MPNHINSQVEITGSKELIEKLVKDTKLKLDLDAESNTFDFNGIVPMPIELLETASPTKVFDTQEEVDAENERRKSLWKDDTDGAILKSEADRRMKEYGALNWYDWSYENWGTKWNAYGVRIIDWSETKVVIDIQTAWGTPEAIWSKLESLGYTVQGITYGEMEGYGTIGDDPESVFDVYVNVEVDYNQLEQGIDK